VPQGALILLAYILELIPMLTEHDPHFFAATVIDGQLIMTFPIIEIKKLAETVNLIDVKPNSLHLTPRTKMKQHFCLKRLNFDVASNDSRLNFDEDSNESDDSEKGCNNVPSPSDLQRIPASELVIPAVTPETFGPNEMHPQQLRYDGNSSSPNLTQANPNSTEANTASMPANINQPPANTNLLRADLAQPHRKYGSLLKRHQALLQHSESPKAMTIRAIKSVNNKSRDLDKKKQVEQLIGIIMDNCFYHRLVWKEIF
jgi:hypothetical protein